MSYRSRFTLKLTPQGVISLAQAPLQPHASRHANGSAYSGRKRGDYEQIERHHHFSSGQQAIRRPVQRVRRDSAEPERGKHTEQRPPGTPQARANDTRQADDEREERRRTPGPRASCNSSTGDARKTPILTPAADASTS